MANHFHPTQEIEYNVRSTRHGDMIVRGDGSWTIVEGSQDADEIAEGLLCGEIDDSEFMWFDD